MSKADTLQQALKNNSGKSSPTHPMPLKEQVPAAAAPKRTRSAPDVVGRKKAYIGAWLNPDFGLSLRMTQLRRQTDAEGKKVFLDDLMAEALNDLFRKYDVPTVFHE